MLQPAGLDFQVLFEAVPTACVVLDPELVVRECNAAFRKVVGQARDHLMGRDLFEVFHVCPSERGTGPSLRGVLQTALATRRPALLGMQRYDSVPRAGGPAARPVERYWAGTAVPVGLGGADAVWLLLNLFEVTALASPETRAEDGNPEPSAPTEEALHATWEVMEQSRLFGEALEAERRLGVAVQSAMLPAGVPEAVRERVSVAVRYQPASTSLAVGGDWYDVTDIGDGRVAVAVGDVVGHGLVAASVMGQLRSALAALMVADVGPPQALTALDQVARHNPDAMASTAVKVVLDPELGFAAYSSAGHLPPLLAHPDGTVEDLDAALGPPLAVTATVARRPLGTATVERGSTLLLYTDGLVERRGEDLDVGIERLRKALATHRGLGVEELADRLLADLTPDSGLSDDVAMVLLRP
jgi:serine phosphatase RsbU (regulator of sigma subunit)